MEKLYDIQKVIFEQFEQKPYYRRDLFKQITLDNKISGIVGARGIVKTTFLLKYTIERVLSRVRHYMYQLITFIF